MRNKIIFKRVNWADHIVEWPNRFKEIPQGDGTVIHEPHEGKIFQPGTPVNAENLNLYDSTIAEIVDVTNDHGDKITSLAVEVATLKGSLLNNFDSNVFIENLANLDDLNVDGGVWDKVNARIVV